MKPYPLFLALGLWVASATGAAATSLTLVDQALAQRLPEVALVRLDALTPRDEAQRREIALKRVEAFLMLGNGQEAARALPEDAPRPLRLEVALACAAWEEVLDLAGPAPSTPQDRLARVAALDTVGRRAEALTLLQSLQAPTSAERLRLAELLLNTAAPAEQVRLVLKLVEPETQEETGWKTLLEMRLLLAQGKAASVLERLSELDAGPFPAPTRLGLLFAAAQAHQSLGDLAAAAETLEKFLWDHRESAQLGAVFERLDALYAADPDASYAALDRMSQRQARQRAGYATYYRARAFLRSQREDRALRLLEAFAQRFPSHPILSDALLLRGRLLIGNGEQQAALETLEEAMRAARDEHQRGKVEIATAMAHFQAKEWVLAATLLEAAGDRAPALRGEATFYAALCWLYQNNRDRFLSDYRILRQSGDPRAETLLIEEARWLARQGDASVRERLRTFLRNHPKSRYRAEANLLLAEWELASGRVDAAAHYLEALGPKNASPQAGAPPAPELAEALAIFVADEQEGRDDEKIAKLSRDYLAKYPKAERAASVRMKLAEIAYRQGDFAGAQNEFETLAREQPGTPLAEGALYLAGEAATKSMSEGGGDRALKLFEEVVRMNGALRHQARLRQAALKAASGEPAEAIRLYDAVLEGEPAQEVRFAALLGKAANLADQRKPEELQNALALYRELGQEAKDAPQWQHQALYHAGQTLEALERPQEALAVYNEVLESGLAKAEGEYFWFYKAGFDAGRLTEQLKNWPGAIEIYRRMASLEGPRREEARARMERLQLEHFIWE